MDQGPLVSEQIEAGARFLAEFENYTPLMAAFWLMASDEDQWFLHVASDQFSEKVGPAYEVVLRIARQMQDPHFDPFQVKIVQATDPAVQAALSLSTRYPGKPMRLQGGLFGGSSVDGVYIYPLSHQNAGRA
jgi:hypothetical protein